MATSSGSHAPPLHDAHLRAALPALNALDERLGEILLPTIAVTAPTPAAIGLWQLAKSLHLLLQALDAGTAAEQAPALSGAGDALDAAARQLRQAQADLLHLQDLAAGELERRMVDVELGAEAIAHRADIEVSLPNGGPARIQISINPATGRASWSATGHDLAPIDGRRQLDLAAGLRMLTEAITEALPGSASEE